MKGESPAFLLNPRSQLFCASGWNVASDKMHESNHWIHNKFLDKLVFHTFINEEVGERNRASCENRLLEEAAVSLSY